MSKKQSAIRKDLYVEREKKRREIQERRQLGMRAKALYR